MTKHIYVLIAAFLISSNGLFSQSNGGKYKSLSGTPAAPQKWDEWFNKEVEKYKETRLLGKTNYAQVTIPVIFHIIHNGEAIGTAPNIAATKIASQVNLLNQVYGGTSAPTPTIGQYANYVANTGITFCLALNDPTNLPIGEAGINRVDAGALFTANTNTMTSDAALMAFIENTVKPATIWDPTKYLNIWISTRSSSVSILGSATYPAGAALQGMGAVGTFSNDGVWCVTNTIGSPADLGTEPNYNEGKTLCREIAHWLGVKNIWGDANCGTDYCADTPPATGPNFACPGAYPYKVNSCHAGSSPGGEMTMNIMDYTYDACRYMFTNDQAIRMQTAMSQCAYRYSLGTHALCTTTVIPAGAMALAQFSFAAPAPCFGQPFTPINYSTGNPAPSYTWVLTPNTATVNFGYNSAMPSFNLTNQGTYTLELIASNSPTAFTTHSIVFTTTLCPKEPNCLDTLEKTGPNDTLTVYSAPPSTVVLGCNVANPGFLTGTNCYNDKEFAQFYSAATYSNTSNPQLSSAIVLFNRAGTIANNPGTNIYLNVWSGNVISGPASLLKQVPAQLANVTATTVATWSTIGSPTNIVNWAGSSTYTFAGLDVYAYKFSFDPPYAITTQTTGFHMGIEVPWTSPGDYTQIYSNSIFNAPLKDSIVFVRNSANNWLKLKDYHKQNVQLAIYPIITCKPPVGVAEYPNSLSNNVNLVPNPNNGVFNIITSFTKEQDLTFKIFNYMGQQIGENKENNVTNKYYEFNLSNHSSGVYFIEVSNGFEKTVKKVIINK